MARSLLPVRLDASVREEREIGDFQFALLDTIALAGEQQLRFAQGSAE
ncbi:hypothetical protein [Mycolicibacterium fortuitum]|nr:hypothetical protein [Mycolicibacterium fortuitum]